MKDVILPIPWKAVLIALPREHYVFFFENSSENFHDVKQRLIV